MKILSIIAFLATFIVLAGCGKKEEPTTSVTEAAAPEAPVVEKAVPAEEAPAVEQAALTETVTAQVEEVVDSVKTSAMAMASSVDWGNLSWNDVAEVPYDDKEKLVQWAAPQINSLKDQLSKAVMDKGMAGLASLGDSGWQGAIKTAVDALETVRTSSPETWELARGALISAWGTLQAEATKYLGES